jgi:hypothetical protein
LASQAWGCSDAASRCPGSCFVGFRRAGAWPACLPSWGTSQPRTRPIPVTKFSFAIPTGNFSPESCIGPTTGLCVCFLPLDWWLPSPRPSGGH